jgi:hypothetical protein
LPDARAVTPASLLPDCARSHRDAMDIDADLRAMSQLQAMHIRERSMRVRSNIITICTDYLHSTCGRTLVYLFRAPMYIH